MSSLSLRKLLKNLKEGKKMVHAWLDEQPLDIPFTHEYLFELLSYHPDNKASNIEYCVMHMDCFYKRTLYFKNVDSTLEDSISWDKCIRNCLGKFKKDIDDNIEIKKAFRNATINEYHNHFKQTNTHNGTGSCSHCGVKCGQTTGIPLHIDHVNNSFKSILQSFLDGESIDIKTVEIIKCGMFPHLSCEDLKKKWVIWHDSRVSYRILCSRCNMSLGDKSSDSSP
jgi:hypothetical protein